MEDRSSDSSAREEDLEEISARSKKKWGKRLHCSEKVVPLHHGSGRKSQMGSRMKLDFVAQLVEQLTLNQWVEGSSPSEVTFNHSSEIEASCV